VLDPSLVALRAWNRAVRGYQAALNQGRLQDVESARRQVQAARSRYQALTRQTESDRSAGFDKVAVCCRHLPVASSFDGAALGWPAQSPSGAKKQSG